MKRDILYVDDEQDNLIVFQATFDDTFEVWTATSGAEALKLLESRSFPVVIADQRMPGMTGAQFFEIMRSEYPHSKRIMLTGYADSKAMMDAINQGQVYYFIKKPWERDVLYPVIVRAIEAYDLTISNVALTDRLVVADRCATLGRSVARIAHEMGNQLCLLPLLELIEEEYSDRADLLQSAEFARVMYERLNGLIQEVKAFIRFEQQEVQLDNLAVAGMVRELVEFLRHDCTIPHEQLQVRLLADPAVRGNRIKLQQVLINLIKNAIHALGDRPEGLVTLELLQENSTAILRVADNGCGMTPETAQRIWEPFFSTKGHEGNGLGLDISKSIVEAHGGTITCESEPRIGTTFSIRLPLAFAPAGTELESSAGGGILVRPLAGA